MISNRGQVFGMDACAGLLLAALAVAALALTWEFAKAKAAEDAYYRAIMGAAISSSDALVGSRGLPSDWETNSSGAIYVGLAGRDRVLDGRKVSALESLQGTRLREAACGGFECRIALRGLDGGLIASAGNVSRAEFTVSVSRPVLYGDGAAFVEVTLGGGG